MLTITVNFYDRVKHFSNLRGFIVKKKYIYRKHQIKMNTQATGAAKTRTIITEYKQLKKNMIQKLRKFKIF